jgi:hypothetical protein
MPFPKEAIAEILQTLDHTNDALWTDDGSPLVSEIQRLANDKTITRAQINDALPGFVRKSADSLTEEVQPEDELATDEVREITETAAAAASEEIAPEDDGFLTEEQETARVRAIAQKRVQEAERALVDAKEAVAEAYRAERAAEQRYDRALTQYNTKFPPISAADNIKQHLARQQEMLRERVTGISSLNPLDAKMQDRKRDNGRKGAPTKFLPRSLAV